MDKQMWLVIENNQYTLEMMKEYFQDQDVEIYGIKEDKIKECIHLHPYKIALVSYLSLQQVSLIRYFKDLNIPVVSGFKIGHCEPNVGIPLGVDVLLDAENKDLAILPGVE